MAVDFGNLNSGLRGSSGNTTWRRVRGRTIQSQKRGKNTKSFYETRAAAGLVRSYREALFYIMTKFADGMQNTVNESFEPTKYGTRRNAFVRLNYSSVEKALNGSELGLAILDMVMHNVSFTGVVSTEAGSPMFSAFNLDGWNLMMRSANSAGTQGAYVRSNIGQTVVLRFSQEWVASEDPSTASITGFVAQVRNSGEGQSLVSVTISGSNLPSPVPYAVRIGAATNAPLTGAWQGYKFVVSGESASATYAGTYTVYLTSGTRVVYSRDVQFYSAGAGGE